MYVICSFDRYLAEISNGINTARWLEYGVSSSVCAFIFPACCSEIRRDALRADHWRTYFPPISWDPEDHDLRNRDALRVLRFGHFDPYLLFERVNEFFRTSDGTCKKLVSLFPYFVRVKKKKIKCHNFTQMNHPDRERVDLTPFFMGCWVGICPWIVVLMLVLRDTCFK